MITEPKIEQLMAQPYIGIRTRIIMAQMPEVIPQLVDESEHWLQQQGVDPADGPFIRYHVINMEAYLDIEIGWPVERPLPGDERISAGVIPAGRYGTLIYTNVTKGIEGNAALIEWAKTNDMVWDAWDTLEGHAFASRIEFMLDGPDDDPDPTQWRTKVAIRLTDD